MKYSEALEIALGDMGMYCQSITTDGVTKERTEWQNGWNAYGMELTAKAGAVSRFFSSLPDEIREQVEALINQDKLNLTAFDNKPLHLLVPCNDLFYWACSDAEDISLEELPALQSALLESPSHGDILWVCRKRGMRPQKPYYKYFNEAEIALFDACGPIRTDE